MSDDNHLCEICGDYPYLCGCEETAKEIAMLRAKVDELEAAIERIGSARHWGKAALLREINEAMALLPGVSDD